jgi:diguanylate cyclase (GGDEF)-like protein
MAKPTKINFDLSPARASAPVSESPTIITDPPPPRNSNTNNQKKPSGYKNFEEASAEILDFLYQKLDFRLWMVTRTEADDWIVLDANDHGYGVKAGDVFQWSDSFCSRMVEGRGPFIAPDAQSVPAYADAPIGRQVEIGSYAGVPLRGKDQKLIGTLCAIDPNPKDVQIKNELPLIQLMARILTTLLENELVVEDEQRKAEHALAKAMSDHLTGLYNRRGWETLLAKEEKRCKRFGLPAGLFSIDLDDLKIVNDKFGHMRGDELICEAANVLKSLTRTSDVVARLGGDEFAILASGCSIFHIEALRERLISGLAQHNISASIGSAMLGPTQTIAETFEKADQLMYEQKNARKADDRDE